MVDDSESIVVNTRVTMSQGERNWHVKLSPTGKQHHKFGFYLPLIGLAN